MPCYDPRDHGETTYVNVRVHGATAAQLDAILCGVLDVDRKAVANLKPGQLIWDLVDWKEVGVPRSVAERWLTLHRKHDKLMRMREKRLLEAESARRKALAKLTEEERKILGIK